MPSDEALERFSRDHLERKRDQHAKNAEEKLVRAEGRAWGDAANIAEVATAHATLAIYYDRRANAGP